VDSGTAREEHPSPDSSSPIKVKTYSTDEPLSVKIRALYGQKKAGTSSIWIARAPENPSHGFSDAAPKEIGALIVLAAVMLAVALTAAAFAAPAMTTLFHTRQHQ
jgi:hypothetical protein